MSSFNTDFSAPFKSFGPSFSNFVSSSYDNAGKVIFSDPSKYSDTVRTTSSLVLFPFVFLQDAIEEGLEFTYNKLKKAKDFGAKNWLISALAIAGLTIIAAELYISAYRAYYDELQDKQNKLAEGNSQEEVIKYTAPKKVRNEAFKKDKDAGIWESLRKVLGYPVLRLFQAFSHRWRTEEIRFMDNNKLKAYLPKDSEVFLIKGEDKTGELTPELKGNLENELKKLEKNKGVILPSNIAYKIGDTVDELVVLQAPASNVWDKSRSFLKNVVAAIMYLPGKAITSLTSLLDQSPIEVTQPDSDDVSAPWPYSASVLPTDYEARMSVMKSLVTEIIILAKEHHIKLNKSENFELTKVDGLSKEELKAREEGLKQIRDNMEMIYALKQGGISPLFSLFKDMINGKGLTL